jgi:putative transposase
MEQFVLSTQKNILEPVEQMNAWIRGAINKKKKWK